MILDFSKISKNDVITAGGKGANLGELVSTGINVPKGFVVTADTYKEFLYINGFEEILKKELLEAGRDKEKLFKLSEKLKVLIKKGKLPENVINEVKSAYKKLGENTPVAVRSSATFEDLADASFAGQQETYLNVRGEEEILARILDCYASLWGDRAIIYRAGKGYNQLLAAMAVVIQEMVESEKAGVLFTANPVTGNINEMQINASYGLGESVVSGRVTADSYIVDKSGKMLYISIGSKETKIIYAQKETKEIEVSKELREQAALSESEVLELVGAGNAIEKHYGCPMDIEWAIKDKKVYILQARAITTLKENFDEKLIKSYLKRRKISKMMKSQMAFQLEKMPFVYRVLDYDYMIAINEQKAKIFDEAGIKINSNPDIDDDGIQTLPKEVKGINRRIFNLPKTIKMMRDYDYCLERCKLFMKGYEREVRKLSKFNFEKMDFKECNEFIVYSYDLTKRLAYDRFKYALFPSVLNKDLERAVKKVDASYTAFDLYRNLNNKTAVVLRDIEDIARKVKKDEKLKEAVISGKSFESICKEFTEFKKLTEDFIKKNGFKSDYNCYCIEAKTFIEEPDRFINIIKPLILQKNENKEESRSFADILNSIEKAYGKKVPKIKNRIEAFRYFHIVREESQYLWETLFYYVRQCLKRTNFLLIGTQEYRFGVANLFHKELVKAIERGCLNKDDLEKIKRRNKNYPLAMKVWEASKLLVFDTDGKMLKGVSGSKGAAIGTARIIKGPEEFYKMQKGDILVCRFTDPEWTPLFSLASAIVADTGSALSHAAIVAREYGIPAVLGVGFATERFKDGDRIKADGDKGTAGKVE